MTPNDKYLSVQEFSELAGVSRQTIYAKLDTTLQKYVKLVKGKKSINTSALTLFDVKGFDNNVKDNLTDLTTDFTEVFSVLQDQLRVKDKQLKDQAEQSNKQLEIKDFQISELNERLKQEQELNKNSQILIGRQQDQPKQIETDPGPVKRSFWSRLFKKEVD